MEEEIRSAIFIRLNERSSENGGVFNRAELENGYHHNGRRITLMGQSGIWTPKGFEAPISITTTTKGPYDDGFSDDGILRYSYRGTDPYHRDNAGLRRAFQKRIPLIYFKSIKPGKYIAVWPVFILRDNPDNLFVEAAIDIAYSDNNLLTIPKDDFYSDNESVLSIRRYIAVQTKQRLHQAAFREFVIDAYNRSCTICRLQHPELLDAAHIIPDCEAGGDPIVPNGLSLCKIHHAAYDQNIIGISPDYRIHIREDLLKEKDGPMLRYGFQSLEGSNIHLPGRKKDLPDRDRLAVRFGEFKSA